MKPIFQKMMRDQVQADLDNPIELIKKPIPKGGWLKVIRKALGMTTYQLAQRLKCSQSYVSTIEKRELAKNISLKSLESAAKAMHCKLVYFLIPEKPINELLEDQARLIATRTLRSIGHSMELEQQGLTPAQQKSQKTELIKELLEGNPKLLWEHNEI